MLPMSPAVHPLPPPPNSPPRERGTRLELSCWSPSSPGEGGGRGREKRAGVMRATGAVTLILPILLVLAALACRPAAPGPAGERIRVAVSVPPQGYFV